MYYWKEIIVLALFEKAEEMLEKNRVSSAAFRDIKVAQMLNVDIIRVKRREKAKTIHDFFSGWLLFSSFTDSDCPLFVPIMVPNRNRETLREYLITHNILVRVIKSIRKKICTEKLQLLITIVKGCDYDFFLINRTINPMGFYS